MFLFIYLYLPVTGLWDISGLSYKLWAELREPVSHSTTSGEFFLYCSSLLLAAAFNAIVLVQIMSYALLRYFSHPLQRYESGLLTGLGSLSVWLFVSHQHILLNQSGSTLLALFPHAPWPVNFALTFCVFFFCLRLMHFARHTLSSSSVARGSVAHPSPPQSNTRTLPFTDQ